MKKTKKQPKGAVEKIRKFREDLYRDYMKRHKKFDIHQFISEFLKRSVSKRA